MIVSPSTGLSNTASTKPFFASELEFLATGCFRSEWLFSAVSFNPQAVKEKLKANRLKPNITFFNSISPSSVSFYLNQPTFIIMISLFIVNVIFLNTFIFEY
ncbi:hypothetical protein PT2222_140380 [Paraburkholderia tropica]